MDSLEIESRYDFSKIRPAKLESTCKFALRFVIWLDFNDFSKVIGKRWKAVWERSRVDRSRFDDLYRFFHPINFGQKSKPYNEKTSSFYK